MKYKINPKYKNLEEDLLNIKEHFASSDESIHVARNILKIAPIKEFETVIKAFKVPHFINRIAYAYFRGSKAKKSYDNALKLISRGVNTPEPIGYLENYKMTLFDTSYYLSIYEHYDFTMRQVVDREVDDYKEIIKQFTAFTCSLHEKGVWHVDYSPGNTLIRKLEDRYEFYIVDVNRMQFRDIDGYEGITNFNKLSLHVDDFDMVVEDYSKHFNLDISKAKEIAVEAVQKELDRLKMKERIKGR